MAPMAVPVPVSKKNAHAAPDIAVPLSLFLIATMILTICENQICANPRAKAITINFIVSCIGSIILKNSINPFNALGRIFPTSTPNHPPKSAPITIVTSPEYPMRRNSR